MDLFKPSEDFVGKLHNYHKIRRKIKNKKPSVELVAKVQEKLANSFQGALFMLCYKTLLTEPGKISISLTDRQNNFCEEFSRILDKKLGLENDSERNDLLSQLARELIDWLKSRFKLAHAQHDEWPYEKLALLEFGGVLVVLNRRADLTLKEKHTE